MKKMLELTEHTTIGEIPEEETVDFDMEAWDDVKGRALDPKAVRQARMKEMKYVREGGVAVDLPGRGPTTRVEGREDQVDRHQQGDEDTPNYQSRVVARSSMAARARGYSPSTPPLEALRFLISEAATVRGREDWEDKVTMVNDVARALFEAPMRRDICVELLAEAGEEEDMVGHLIMSIRPRARATPSRTSRKSSGLP